MRQIVYTVLASAQPANRPTFWPLKLVYSALQTPELARMYFAGKRMGLMLLSTVAPIGTNRRALTRCPLVRLAVASSRHCSQSGCLLWPQVHEAAHSFTRKYFGKDPRNTGTPCSTDLVSPNLMPKSFPSCPVVHSDIHTPLMAGIAWTSGMQASERTAVQATASVSRCVQEPMVVFCVLTVSQHTASSPT